MFAIFQGGGGSRRPVPPLDPPMSGAAFNRHRLFMVIHVHTRTLCVRVHVC